ncbi:hypothetical protein CCACVL1_23083 [Corchorus capsularis]|uniref:Uncharacterized protein n=1 Tax=Corchorus capsularis TaxID=210143 RepID=A0A1R3GV64_COCAP|nr:hypothetical protein CCACVL1_23083 [Corchorus capsularis]
MAQIDPAQRYGNNPRNPIITNPTVEQLLRAEDAETRSPSGHSSSPTFSRSQGVVHDPEDAHYQPKKLTVLAKVKEKARRWRNSFSKRKHGNSDNTTPSWGVRLEDVDNEEEDPEYLGAPMYESELAPEGYKEHARQHPRAISVISEKHILPGNVHSVAEAETKKPAPANFAETDETWKIDSKFQGLSVSAPTASETEKHETNKPGGVHEADHKDSNAETDKHALQNDDDSPISPTENKWDKGVSVKEYLKNKLEPGEDERALSRVISDVMSPRRAPGEVGVIEKVKGAVNSLLRREESAQSTMEHSTANSSTNNAEAVMKEEENKGRILQAN